jgi:hypothetical protein
LTIFGIETNLPHPGSMREKPALLPMLDELVIPGDAVRRQVAVSKEMPMKYGL